MPTGKPPPGAKSRLLDAAVDAIRASGYSATTVDDICETAGLTKGAFFHHFASKEALAVAAARHFASRADGLFSTAPYQDLADPVDRLLRYVDFRKALLQGELYEFTCLLGTMVQEAYATLPEIREACDSGLRQHTTMLEADITAALRARGGDGQWSAASLAAYMQAVIQGALILAKAQQGPAVATACLEHLRRYIQMLFSQPRKSKGHHSDGRRNPVRRLRAPRRAGGHAT